MNTGMTDHVELSPLPSYFAQRLSESGQLLLAAGRYVAARRELEAAESQAFLRRDAALLAGIYLPLLEAARQIRQFCCDGIIAVTPGQTMDQKRAVHDQLRCGGVWLAIESLHARNSFPIAVPTEVPFESLRLFQHRRSWQIAAHHHGTLGIAVLWTSDAGRLITPANPEELVAILPPPGIYRPGNPHHAQARETLLLVFEALALRWLARQGKTSGGWAALAVLREARRIDPACERILMRMMDLAESLI